MNKAFKNSTPGKVAYIWRIERFQIDAIKFERTQIHFFSDVFTVVIVVVVFAPTTTAKKDTKGRDASAELLVC